MNVVTNAAGLWAVRGTPRCAELWITDRIAFDNRPGWQSAPDGPVAALHHALSRMRPQAGDALACVWACDHPASRPDVENRLFTNVIPKPRQALRGPNPFAHLPARVLLERSFRSAPPLDGFDTSQCLYYRYALSPHGGTSSEWQTPGSPPLATWPPIAATGLSTGNGWATWASMRRPGVSVNAEDSAAPHTGDFALRLLVRSPVPFALVSNMEWIIDGVIASLQREPDTVRAEVISSLIRSNLAALGLAGDLVAAQCEAPRVFAPPPFLLYKNHTGCRLNPADHLLVRADIELAVIADLKSPDLSGAIHQVTPKSI
jgi:hypothetical protein